MADDIIQTIGLIQKDLSLNEDSLPGSVTSLDELKNKLIPVIRYLLDKDMTRLLNALYRIDIKESKVKYVLTIENPDNIAPALAEMIIQRELQKIATRKQYRDQSL